MGHYDEQREQRLKIGNTVLEVGENVERAAGDLPGMLSEMFRAKESIKHDFERVRSSDKVQEFSEKVKHSGTAGLMGLIPKIGELVPEVAPLYNALMKANEVDQLQTKIIMEMAKRIEALEGKVHGR